MVDSMSSHPPSASETDSTVESERYWVKTFPVGPLQCNCTIIGDRVSGEAIVVDPGGDGEAILSMVEAEGFKVTRLLHTHAHFDHILAAGEIHEKTGASIDLHPEDRFLWDNLEMQCQLFGMDFTPQPDPTHSLDHEEEVSVGQDLTGQAIHTPGHTPGSTSFWFEDLNLLLAGDTLFRGSIGRTDLWGGDFTTIAHSIKDRLYTLNEEATVIPGHGPSTSLGREMRQNAVVRAGE